MSLRPQIVVNTYRQDAETVWLSWMLHLNIPPFHLYKLFYLSLQLHHLARTLSLSLLLQLPPVQWIKCHRTYPTRYRADECLPWCFCYGVALETDLPSPFIGECRFLGIGIASSIILLKDLLIQRHEKYQAWGFSIAKDPDGAVAATE